MILASLTHLILMFDFIEYATKAQTSLQAEMSKLDTKAADLEKVASEQAQKATDLLAREISLNDKEKQLNDRESAVVMYEKTKKREEDVEAQYSEAMKAQTIAQELLKKSKEYDADASQKIAELEKRELALSEREKSYRETLQKEFAQKLFNTLA